MSGGAGRVIILVLDGLGIGAMPDAEPPDLAADTLGHLGLDDLGGQLPFLGEAGLLALRARERADTGRGAPGTAAVGRAALGYPGADTVLGHLTMMGIEVPAAAVSRLADSQGAVIAALHRAGARVDTSCDPRVLVVDDCLVVHDNVEAGPGLGVNVTASLDEVDWERIVEVATILRGVVPNPRVIAVGGHGFVLADALEHVVERTPEHAGLDTPGLGVYARPFLVRHLVLPVDEEALLSSRCTAAGIAVALLGKAADVIPGPADLRAPLIETDAVLASLEAALGPFERGLIVANIQETDLAGHERDSRRFVAALAAVDSTLPSVRSRLVAGDVLIVTADHGNDPTLPGTGHTREYVPIVAMGDMVRPAWLGTRTTLADIGATAGELLGLEPAGVGSSFAPLLAMPETVGP